MHTQWNHPIWINYLCKKHNIPSIPFTLHSLLLSTEILKNPFWPLAFEFGVWYILFYFAHQMLLTVHFSFPHLATYFTDKEWHLKSEVNVPKSEWWQRQPFGKKKDASIYSLMQQQPLTITLRRLSAEDIFPQLWQISLQWQQNRADDHAGFLWL